MGCIYHQNIIGGLLLLYKDSPGFSKHLAFLMEARAGEAWITTHDWLTTRTLSGDSSLQSHRPCRSLLFHWRQDLHRATLQTCNSRFPQSSSIIHIYPKNAHIRGPKAVLQDPQKRIEAIGNVIWAPQWLISIVLLVFHQPSLNGPINPHSASPESGGQ